MSILGNGSTLYIDLLTGALVIVYVIGDILMINFVARVL